MDKDIHNFVNIVDKCFGNVDYRTGFRCDKNGFFAPILFYAANSQDRKDYTISNFCLTSKVSFYIIETMFSLE